MNVTTCLFSFFFLMVSRIYGWQQHFTPVVLDPNHGYKLNFPGTSNSLSNFHKPRFLSRLFSIISTPTSPTQTTDTFFEDLDALHEEITKMEQDFKLIQEKQSE